MEPRVFRPGEQIDPDWAPIGPYCYNLQVRPAATLHAGGRFNGRTRGWNHVIGVRSLPPSQLHPSGEQSFLLGGSHRYSLDPCQAAAPLLEKHASHPLAFLPDARQQPVSGRARSSPRSREVSRTQHVFLVQDFLKDRCTTIRADPRRPTMTERDQQLPGRPPVARRTSGGGRPRTGPTR